MKGIILAGGMSKRLFPLTEFIGKQLLPVYNKPMIYYPVSLLMNVGIRDILVISAPKDLYLYKKLLGTGEQWGVRFSYQVQTEAKGIADALSLGEAFINNEQFALVLGDNVFCGKNLNATLENKNKIASGAQVFSCYVDNPNDYGVIEFGLQQEIISLEEKPERPKSNFIVTGLYFYDNKAFEYIRDIKPSARGELEITDVNRAYLQAGNLQANILEDDIFWFDTGTSSALLRASNAIQKAEEVFGVLVGSPEEVAFRKGWIEAADIEKLVKKLDGTDYGNLLLKLLDITLAV